jgi:hypothetical protein
MSLPAIGHVPVSKWRVEHSQLVIDRASKTAHARGREDVRGVLAAMRKLAWPWSGSIADSIRWTVWRSGGRRCSGRDDAVRRPEPTP